VSFEDFLKIAVPMTVVLGPLFAAFFSISSRLAKIEERIGGENKRIDEALARHEHHIHEIRNSLQAITLDIARRKDEGR
jgi:hypothetical protein